MAAITTFLINGRFLARRPTGVDRFATELTLAIDRLLALDHPLTKGTRWCLVGPEAAAHGLNLRAIDFEPTAATVGTLWEQLRLPTLVGERVLVNLCNVAPLALRRQALVVHDIAPMQVPESYTAPFRNWYRFAIPLLCQRSQAVATVSNFSRDEILPLCRPNYVPTVISEGCDHMQRISADPRVLDRLGLRTGRPFVLAVGSQAPHKNLILLSRAMRLLRNPGFELVVAGGKDPRIFGSSTDLLPTAVRHVGYVTDAELKALYGAAHCFVFPSLYEGFGLPPVEAMACGCPVLSSTAGALPATCAEAALFFDPHDADALAALMQRVVEDQDLRSELVRRSVLRASDLTWNIAALDVLHWLRKSFMPPQHAVADLEPCA